MPVPQRLLIKTMEALTGRGRLMRRYRDFAKDLTAKDLTAKDLTAKDLLFQPRSSITAHCPGLEGVQITTILSFSKSEKNLDCLPY